MLDPKEGTPSPEIQRILMNFLCLLEHVDLGPIIQSARFALGFLWYFLYSLLEGRDHFFYCLQIVIVEVYPPNSFQQIQLL